MANTTGGVPGDLQFKLLLNKYSARVKNSGFFIGSIVWVCIAIIRAASFSLQVLFRYAIGRSSFSLFTVLLAFIWVALFVNINLTTTEFSDTPSYSMQDFISNVGALDKVYTGNGSGRSSTILYFLSFIVVIFGFFNFFYEMIAENKPYAEFRGKSFLFNWLQKKNLGIDKGFFQRVLEPLIALITGILLYILGNRNGLFLFFIISALALFWEEHKMYDYERTMGNPNRRAIFK